MSKPKGIRLDDTQTDIERRQTIRDYVVSLGGNDFKYRGDWATQKDWDRRGKYYVFPASREGVCESGYYWGHDCFGARWLDTLREMPNVRQRCHSRYLEVRHITLDTCESRCFGKGVVVCVRELRSGVSYMTHHIIGKCPYCDYKLHDYYVKKLEDK